MIGVDSGWEVYVAGNGGIKTEVTQFLCKVKTHDEVLEYSGAFLQLYREEARYLDRTVHYVSRLGLDYVTQRVGEDIPKLGARVVKSACGNIAVFRNSDDEVFVQL